MSEIESEIRKMVGGTLDKLGCGGSMRKLIVAIAALVGAYLAYRWLRDNLEKVVE